MRFSGYSSLPGSPGNLVAGGPSFDINRGAGALGGRSGEQLKRLYEGGTQQNEKLNEELMRRGIMPGAGPQLPQAFSPFYDSNPFAVGNVGSLAMNQGPSTPVRYDEGMGVLAPYMGAGRPANVRFKGAGAIPGFDQKRVY
jgi:hypothetical protein